MRKETMTRRLAIGTWLSVVALVLFVAYVPMGSTEKTQPTPTTTDNTAVFTGTFVDGMPLYRLPPIDVVGYRKADVALRARHDSRSRAGAV